MFGPFKKASVILNKLQTHGHEAYFVGGAVRDFLLQRQIGDVDIATSATPTDILSLFEHTVDVGIEHGTIIVLIDSIPFEVTTFRAEDQYEDYRRPSKVAFIKSLKDDLQRRDFTMNAMAMTLSGEIIDPFNGKHAISEGLIETVGNPSERFNEDALRIMRGVRFVSQLNFKLAPQTKEAMKTHGYLLSKISVERITTEFEKIITSQFPNKGLSLLLDSNLYQYLPTLKDYSNQLTEVIRVDWSRLNSNVEGWTLLTYILEVKNPQTFLKAWKLSNKTINAVLKNLTSIEDILSKGWTNLTLYRIGLVNLPQIHRLLAVIQNKVTTSIDFLTDRYQGLVIKSRDELVINGVDVINWSEKKAGPWVSEALSAVELAVLDGQLENDREKIKEWLLHCNRKSEKNY
ncbi:CCA tRNA nucleotidyltransferase [Litchfieldia alkalitelluris]|uniref:CCA tRNA nucleotidyltransferase n=1 Tax=Litchfieldia alkalitelluris TaxID=304268 RepID=UPI000998826A|nr:CCA tRNA nucleotidyltransferase [Litchfieldia alkalitelluris]